TSRFHIEGPINRGKTTFILGGRMTYSDWILKRLPEESNYHGGKAGFGDANLGITHKFDESNSLRLSAYWAKDRFAFSEGEDFNYSNLDVSLAWKHDFEDPGHNLRVSASYDGFVNTFDIYKYMNDYSVTTNINQGNLKAVIRKPLSDAHVLSYGAEGVFYALDPGIMKPLNDSSLVAPRSLDREYAVEAAAFASDTYTISEKLSFEAGLRLSGFMSASKMRFYGIPELRLSGKYSPKENISLKAGFNTLRQYIHLISNTSAISPMDTWKLSDASIKPTDGYQAALGGYWTSLDTGIDFSLETYWKNMYNYLDYKSGAELTMNDNLAEALVPVKGKAYGVEFMIKKTTGKLNGWASYTYSRTFLREMTDRGVATINGGDWYQAPYDKPHDLKVALNYAFTHRYSISLNLDYSTGRPVTIPIGSYLYDGGYRLAYSERNAYRIPDYFRLDAAINIDPGHYLKALTHSSITIGVYNLTGRKNPYSVYYTTDGGFVPNGYMVSVFATQIPYINFNLIF
ncbi:MAG: TonB-dependent receptor, partial [Bacteroidales bacterium]|nr:TonB-dependent receptor [Bacteroidales bacterium]